MELRTPVTTEEVISISNNASITCTADRVEEEIGKVGDRVKEIDEKHDENFDILFSICKDAVRENIKVKELIDKVSNDWKMNVNQAEMKANDAIFALDKKYDSLIFSLISMFSKDHNSLKASVSENVSRIVDVISRLSVEAGTNSIVIREAVHKLSVYLAEEIEYYKLPWYKRLFRSRRKHNLERMDEALKLLSALKGLYTWKEI